VGCFAAARSVARALETATRRAEEVERGISSLAQFEASGGGRAVLQRLQREHPLLVRTSMGEASIIPPPVSAHEPRPG
jgi:hypothetical protein